MTMTKYIEFWGESSYYIVFGSIDKLLQAIDQDSIIPQQCYKAIITYFKIILPTKINYELKYWQFKNQDMQK